MADEEDEDALKAAQDALSYFKSKKDSANMCEALFVIVWCYIAQNRIGEASALAQENMESFRKAGKPALEGKMLLALSEVVAADPKQADEALSQSKKALALFRSAGDQGMEAKVWLNTAKILVAKLSSKKDDDALSEADQAASDALAIYQRTNDQKGEAAALHAAASVKAVAGDLDEATELAEQAVDLYQELELKKMEASELHNVAKWCVKSKPNKALNYAEDALMIARDNGASKKKEADILGTVVEALIAKYDTGRAVRVALHGLRRAQDAGEASAEAAIHRTLFHAYTANGETQQAAATLDKALEASQDSGDRSMEAQLLCVAAETSHKAEMHDQAVSISSKALSAAHSTGDWDAILNSLKILVNSHLAKGDAGVAASAAKEVQDSLSSAATAGEQVSTSTLVGVSLLLSQALNAAGDYNEAVAATKMAVESAYQGDDEVSEAKCLDQLAAIYMDARKFEKACRTGERARLLWQSLENIEEEASSLYQICQSYISQAYKKQAEGKASAASALIEKGDKALGDGMKITMEKVPSPQKEVLQANFMIVAAQKHLAVEGENVGAYNAAKAAVDIFNGLGDVKGAANGQFFVAQAQVFMEKWDSALKSVSAAMKVFKKYNNEEGIALADTLTDKIQKSMPKPEPVYAPQQMMQWGPMAGPAGKGKGKGKMMEMPMDAGGGGEVAKRAPGAALDMSSVTEEVAAVKVKEVAMGLIGDGEDIEVDTPLMEAGLTSSTAVILKDELSEEMPGIKLPPTLIFDYPSISAIAEFVMEQVKK